MSRDALESAIVAIAGQESGVGRDRVPTRRCGKYLGGLMGSKEHFSHTF